MLDKRSQRKLERYIAKRKTNVARGIYIMHRYVDEWIQAKWKEDGWKELRHGHLKLLSIIGMEPVNINVLSKRARVSKQAMGRMVNELISKGFIAYETDPKDSRSKIISITKNGVDSLDYLIDCGKLMEKKIESIIGKKKTQQLTFILGELAEGILEIEKEEWSK